MKKLSKELLSVHFAVFLFGSAGLFGKWLTVSPWTLVLGRTLFAAIALGVLLLLKKEKKSLLPSASGMTGMLILLGILLAAHWVSFFRAIQLSTVALGLLTFSSFPLFTVFLEPLMLKEKFRTADLIPVIGILTGLMFIVKPEQVEYAHFSAVLFGIFSGFSFAVLTVLNRKCVRTLSPIVIGFWQNTAAFVVLIPLGLGGLMAAPAADIYRLILLGVLFTAIAHAAFIYGLKRIRSRLAAVIASLEPVYGIILALLIFNEIPSLKTVIGGIFIVGSVFFATAFRKNSASM